MEYLEKTEALAEALDRENWIGAVMLHEQSWRIDALLEHQGRMDDDDFAQCVRLAWTVNENVWRYKDVLPRLFDPVGRTTEWRRKIMTEDERAVYDDLPPCVRIYRGCGSSNRDGWSWTTRRDQAEWFGRRLEVIRREQFSGLLLS